MKHCPGSIPRLKILVLIFAVTTCNLHAFGLVGKKDTIQASQYYEAANRFFNVSKYDSAILYYKKAGEEYRRTLGWESYMKSFNGVGNSFLKLMQYDSVVFYLQNIPSKVEEGSGTARLEEANALECLGIAYNRKAKYSNAQEYLEKALAIRVDVLDSLHSLVADSYLNLGILYYSQRAYAQALDFYHKALGIWQTHGESADTKRALVFSNLARLYASKGQCGKGMSFGNKALAIHSRSSNPDPIHYYQLYNNLGILQVCQSNYEMAEIYFKQGLDILTKTFGKQHPGMVNPYNNLGVIFDEKGNYRQAEKFYGKALELTMIFLGEEHPMVSIAYLNLGIIHYTTQNYHSAVEYFQKSLTLFIRALGASHTNVAHAYINLGNCYKELGDFENAIVHHKKSLDIRLKVYGEEHPSTAESYKSLGDVFYSKSNFGVAEEYYQKAMDIRKRILGHQHPDVANSYYALGTLYDWQGKFDEALYQFQTSLSIWLGLHGEDHPGVVQALDGIGRIFYKKKRYTEALAYYQEGLRAIFPGFDKTDWRMNPVLDKNVLDKTGLLRLLQNKAKTLVTLYRETSRDVDDLQTALDTYALAVELIDLMSFDHRIENDRLFFNEKAMPVYKAMVEARMLLSHSLDDDDAGAVLFSLSEKSKAGILRQALYESQARHYAGIPADVLTKENDYRVDIAYYATEIQKRRPGEQYDTALIESFKSRLFALHRSYDSLIRLLEKQYPNYHRLKYQNNVISVSDSQQLLDDETALLEYFMTDSTLLVYTLTANTFEVSATPLPSNFETVIKEFRRSLMDETFIEQSVSASTQTYLASAHSLYKWLLEVPLGKLPVQTRRLLIVPSGILATFPFEALLRSPYSPINGTTNKDPAVFRRLDYLFNAYDVSYAYSATLLKEQLAGAANKTSPQALFAGFAPGYEEFARLSPDTLARPMLTRLTRAGHYDLPGAKEEVRQLASLLGGDAWIGEVATEKAFKSVASQYQLLHFAMHGLLDDQRPGLSKLLFAPVQDTVEDNFLHASEIYATSMAAELVVLSACNTGYGKLHSGEGLMSLSRAFVYAGCPSVVNSLWQAPDTGTPTLMVNFYRHLQKGQDKAAALRQAKVDYLATADLQYLHPYYWAPFVIHGDTSPVTMTGHDDKFNWPLLLMGLVISLGIVSYAYSSRFLKM